MCVLSPWGMKAQPNRYSISVAPTGRARCRACKGLVACGAVRLVTLAVVSERRVTKFVRHGTCVSAAQAALVLEAHGGEADQVPVVGNVPEDNVKRVRAMLREMGCTVR